MEILNHKEFKVTDEMLASTTKRFINLVIDRVLFYAFFLLIGFIIAMIAALLGSEDVLIFLENLDNINRFTDIIVTSVFYIIYYFVFESIFQRTIGKLITQTKVVLENGEKPPADVIIKRSLCRVIPFEPFSFLGNVPTGWHDTMSKTYVVDTKIFEEHQKSHIDFQLIGQPE